MNVNIFFIAHSGSDQRIADGDVRHGLIVALHYHVNVTGWQIQTSFKTAEDIDLVLQTKSCDLDH